MTSEVMESLLPQLQRKLGMDEEPEEEMEDRLKDALTAAESELLLYLGVCRLRKVFYPKLIELAALYYQRDATGAQATGVKAQSVTEGGLSQSVTYLTSEDYERQAQSIFHSLARFRQVRVR